MSANFTGASSPRSNSSLSIFSSHCANTAVGMHVLTAFSFAYTLLILPLSLSVLYLGFQQWVSSAATMTHSNFFTYNMAVTELIAAFGYLLYYCSSYGDLSDMLSVGIILMFFTWPGQTLFPILTCVDQYLAVVHPIAYRGLRGAGGVRIRNVSAGCIWLICAVWMAVVILLDVQPYHRYTAIAFTLALSLIVMVFCSLSVLRVLIRPGPGQVRRNRKQVDQLKQRAVRTMLIIMAMLWLKFGGSVIATIVKFLPVKTLKCVTEALSFVFFLPNGVVLPLMFLHRAGKLTSCLRAAASG